MTPSFFGRATELAELAAAWTGPRSAFVPIYGRRRTGKSRLIVEFAVGKPAIYHVGKQGPAPLQRREFLQLAAVTLDEPLLAQVPVETWAEAFRLVDERWKELQRQAHPDRHAAHGAAAQRVALAAGAAAPPAARRSASRAAAADLSACFIC